VYNFHFSFDNPGSRHAFFAGWSGYSYGVSVHFKHEGGGSDYATCNLNVTVKKAPEDSYLTNAAFVSVASIGVAGLLTKMFLRRRREILAEDVDSEEDQQSRKETEMSTNFALVEDGFA
jgi:hypothetical protein